LKPNTKFKYGLADYNIAKEIEALTDVFSDLDGERVDSPDWDLLWYFKHEPPSELYKNISDLRRINHIPGISALTDKWELYNNLRCQWETSGLDKKTESTRRYFPKSWMIPENKEEINQHLLEKPEKPLILKGLHAVNGMAMKLIKYGDELPDDEKWIVQEYIENPHLINDRKYILQVFLLITSCQPLTAYLFQDGVADLAVLPYSSDPKKWDNPGIHIATTILQSQQQGFDLKQHCLTIQQWQSHLAETGDAEIVWERIETVLRQTLLAVAEPLGQTANSQLAHPEQCFELLAVDIMLDSELNPWLVECNRSASMNPQYTGKLKPALLKDALGLILERRQVLSDTPTDQAAPQPASEFGNFRRII